jgi:hypothetical protein
VECFRSLRQGRPRTRKSGTPTGERTAPPPYPHRTGQTASHGNRIDYAWTWPKIDVLVQCSINCHQSHIRPPPAGTSAARNEVMGRGRGWRTTNQECTTRSCKQHQGDNAKGSQEVFSYKERKNGESLAECPDADRTQQLAAVPNADQ